ncbi:erythroid membrane-associated protein-like [Erythrolamprus reginae]|uniref:erythroid membrane-associated protein-like n=1 Tax=Erythrolamprus reginae TaxID=121349 RepID=UPI00396CB9A1
MSEANVNEIQELQERFTTSLELERNKSHAVAVYLDSECKHPDLIITKDQKRATLEAFGEAKSAGGSLVVVGKEGYVAGKHYWEVRVGDRLDWELGVLTQAQRDKARKENFSMPLGEGHWALRSVRGDLFFSQSKENVEKKTYSYSNIGLFLDQESRKLYFYNAYIRAPFLITTITIHSTEKLYPFLSFNECASEHVKNTL